MRRDNLLARLEHWLSSSSRLTVALLSTGLVLLIGFADYASGIEISLSVIYMFPIMLGAWYVSRLFAFGLSILSVVVWIIGDFSGGLVVSSWLVPVWNAAIRLVFYGVTIELLGYIRTLTIGLEARVSQRTRELRKEAAERARLERDMLEVSERERQRLGYDLHDGLCQHLTGTALRVQVLSEKLGKRGLPEAADAARAVDLIEAGITVARNVARGLQPIDMHSGGLMQALEDFAAITKDLFGISCRFECQSPILISDLWTANHLYNIVREATSNAIKHGRANNVVISLDAHEDGTLLNVQDDGNGMPAIFPKNGGMGLRIMNQRALLIGAKLDIARSDPKGATVSCFLPQLSNRLQHA